MDELTRALERVLADRRPTDRYKAPKYDGSSDVELFVTHFTEVTAANGWNDAAAIIHLRTALEGAAKDCARGATVAAINTSLRSRFGVTIRQARDRLVYLRRESGQSLHELGVEINRLLLIAYPALDDATRQTMGVETFKRALDNKQLHRHLFLLDPGTVDAAVVATDEFFNVGSSAPRQRIQASQVETEECGDHPPPSSDTTMTTLKTLVAAVEANTAAIKGLCLAKQEPPSTSVPRNKGPCWICGGPHVKRACPKFQGNASGPQQQ